jgi:hypothetical protein
MEENVAIGLAVFASLAGAIIHTGGILPADSEAISMPESSASPRRLTNFFPRLYGSRSVRLLAEAC